jgi:hypothetical protein
MPWVTTNQLSVKKPRRKIMAIFQHPFPRKAAVTFILFAGLLMLAACSNTTTTLQTHRSPAFSTVPLKSVAILPIQNSFFSIPTADRLEQEVAQAFASRNADVQVISPSDTRAQYVADYSSFLRDYNTYGRLDKPTLAQMADSLKVDAVLHGAIISMEQQDGFPFPVAYTKVKITYALIGLRSAEVLWNVSAVASVRKSTFSGAPDSNEALASIQKMVLDQLPQLAH